MIAGGELGLLLANISVTLAALLGRRDRPSPNGSAQAERGGESPQRCLRHMGMTTHGVARHVTSRLGHDTREGCRGSWMGGRRDRRLIPLREHREAASQLCGAEFKEVDMDSHRSSNSRRSSLRRLRQFLLRPWVLRMAFGIIKLIVNWALK